MKYVHHFFIVFQLLYGVTLGALAQAPQVIHYQAVIHDGADVLSNTEIVVRTSILQWEAEFPGSPNPQISRDIAINSFLKLPLAGYREVMEILQSKVLVPIGLVDQNQDT